MKKFAVSALTALCLMGAFAFVAQDSSTPTNAVAIARSAMRFRWC